MRPILKLLGWILKALVFFVLFAFSLNNQEEVTLHFLFSYQWSAPLTLVVLISFMIGLTAGALGMLHPWWSDRSKFKKLQEELKILQSTQQISSTAQPPNNPTDHAI